MQQHTIKVHGAGLPDKRHVRILTYNDQVRGWFSEITGPETAFDIIEGAQFDKVKVVLPDLVDIKTLRAL